MVTIDWRQLRRWNISEARVPATAVVRFREAGAWEKYRLYIIGAVSLVGLQTRVDWRIGRPSSQSPPCRARAPRQLRAYPRSGGASDHARRKPSARASPAICTTMLVNASRLSPSRLEHSSDGSAGQTRSCALTSPACSAKRSRCRRTCGCCHTSCTPACLQQLGLVEALRARCDELRAESGLSVGLDVGPELGVVSDELSLCLYRVAQEALRNVVTHAQAQTVRAVTRTSRRPRCPCASATTAAASVAATARRTPASASSVWKSACACSDGTFTVDSSDRSGTTVSVTIPCDDSDATTARAVGR